MENKEPIETCDFPTCQNKGEKIYREVTPIPTYQIYTCESHNIYINFPILTWIGNKKTEEEDIRIFIKRKPYRLMDFKIKPQSKRQNKMIEQYYKEIEFLKVNLVESDAK